MTTMLKKRHDLMLADFEKDFNRIVGKINEAAGDEVIFHSVKAGHALMGNGNGYADIYFVLCTEWPTKGGIRRGKRHRVRLTVEAKKPAGLSLLPEYGSKFIVKGKTMESMGIFLVNHIIKMKRAYKAKRRRVDVTV